MLRWLKTLVLLPTALAAVTSLAEGLALAQYGAINVEWSLVVIQGGSNMTGIGVACLHTNQSRSYLNHLVEGTHRSMVCVGGGAKGFVNKNINKEQGIMVPWI